VARKSDQTRAKILGVAERLFAAKGVDRVTLREIARHANQSNVAAVQYHFGTKAALLSELLDRHIEEIDAQRGEMLDALEASGQTQTIVALLQVLVEPLMTKLGTRSGRAYLQIQAQRIREGRMRPATRRVAAGIRRRVGFRAPDAARDRFAILLLFSALADRARQEETKSASSQNRDVFAAQLQRALLGLYAGLSSHANASGDAALLSILP
jgi:AcrR family transcriptional regulator